MAKLTLKLNGAEIKTLELHTGQEYKAGMDDDCDFPLDDHRGISRHHLKFYVNGGVWVCESLSRFLHPQVGTENFESLELSEDISFSLPPYEFEFRMEAESIDAAQEEYALGPEEDPSNTSALVPTEAPVNHFAIDEVDDTNPGFGTADSTQVGSLQLLSLLRINYPNSSSDNEVLKLEGSVWMAGRETDCEIQLRNPKVSRKHFELSKSPEGYFLTDLGSSNGTYINGHRVAPHEPTRLQSGDQIRVLDIEIHFEIKAANLPAISTQPLALPQNGWLTPFPQHSPSPYGNLPTPYADGPTYYGEEPSYEEEVSEGLLGKIKAYDWKKNKVRVVLMALIPVLLVGLLLDSDPQKKSDAAKNETAGNASFENLSKEQKSAIKDSLNLARNLYVQGKYSLCLAELAKLHVTVPFYDNSKELESFCVQGHELTQRKIDEERKERQKALVEQKIADIIAVCTEKHTTKGTVSEVKNCLTDAIELNPEHPKVIELLQAAEAREREKELLAQQQKEAAEKRQQLLSIFNRAQSYKSKGDLLNAQKTYQRFISQARGGLSTQVSTAKRELATVSKSLQEKISLMMEKCNSLGESGKYKEAYKACDEALKENPSLKDAVVAKERYSAALRQQMRTLYQDAKLEESLGNLATAKEKWKRIVEEDLPNGEFHKKSSLKIKQYGGF